MKNYLITKKKLKFPWTAQRFITSDGKDTILDKFRKLLSVAIAEQMNQQFSDSSLISWPEQANTYDLENDL
jgi:hypothetical protein